MSLSFLHLPFPNRIWIFREIFFLLFSPEAHAGALVEPSRANRLPPVCGCHFLLSCAIPCYSSTRPSTTQVKVEYLHVDIFSVMSGRRAM